MAALARGAFVAVACIRAASGLNLRADADAGGNLSSEALGEMSIDMAACAAQIGADDLVMSDLVQAVGMGNHSLDTAEAWRAYQDKLAAQLREDHPEGQRSRPFRTLVVSAVHDKEWMVEIFHANMKRLMSNKAGDVFEFALFHIDSSTEEWSKHEWYRDETGPVMLKHHGAGCKPQFWALITPKIAAQYDYLWLLDEDIRVDFLNWDFYRTVLATLDPMVSQPVIIPKAPYKRSTGVTRLRMAMPRESTFVMAFETPRSEVQAPVISTKIWAAVHERNMGNDRLNDWYIDDFWDAVAFLGEAKCKMTGVLAVNAAPVRHMDCHNLFKGTKCVEGCGEDDANCRAVSSTEESLVREALKDAGCDVPRDWARICGDKDIHACHTALWERSRRKTWLAPL
mmetsp:Transcript_35722/g.100341  ORF Transcript_35722/g.100341 Transcript_35722/m.100341 type:complete len:398 (-) Transcript_35722:132-1325(-)